MRPAVVLFSGGLDSSTCLAVAREEGFAPHALAVRYGQRHEHELIAAERVARALATPLKVVSLDLRAIGGSALTSSIEVPKDAPIGEGIPVTYVPARNTVLLALALGYAETIDAQDLYIGVNAIDYSGYPDCRPAFVEAFEKLANVATAAAVEGRATYRVHAPLLKMTKAQIVRRAVEGNLNNHALREEPKVQRRQVPLVQLPVRLPGQRIRYRLLRADERLGVLRTTDDPDPALHVAV